jgi:hypothetical protein
MLSLAMTKFLVVVFSTFFLGLFALSVTFGLAFMEFRDSYSFKISWLPEFLDGSDGGSK